MRKTVVISLCAVVMLAGCDSAPKPDTTDAQYKLGYASGEEDGRAGKCAQIAEFSTNIHEALQNEGICS